jgi:hypothetical protein
MEYTATYSPQDNKIRLTASERLDAETYDRVKAAGYKWAPKQGTFIAPMWTPAREDLAIELAGIIQDEDSTMEERAAERAERFEGYSSKRAQEAEQTHAAVERITEGIPFGQPILIGHHSQRKAEKDAQRIENGMRKTIKLWETSEYWEHRAAASIAHARYKELPKVRHNRIRTLEAEGRGFQRQIDESRRVLAIFDAASPEQLIQAWRNGHFHDSKRTYIQFNDEAQAYELARSIEECRELRRKASDHFIADRQRWLDHTNNRIAYERAMLGDWEPVKVERRKPDLAPLCNFEVPGCIKMTAAEWKRCSQYDTYKVKAFNADGSFAGWREKGHYRQRTELKGFKQENIKPVFITDMAVKTPPAAPVEVSANA